MMYYLVSPLKRPERRAPMPFCGRLGRLVSLSDYIVPGRVRASFLSNYMIRLQGN